MKSGLACILLSTFLDKDRGIQCHMRPEIQVVNVMSLSLALLLRLTFNRATTIAQRNLQKPAPHMLQKKAVNQRYTRESQITKLK